MNRTITFLKVPNRLLVETGIVIFAILAISIPFITHSQTLTRQLELGMRGNDVSALQTFLARDNTIYPQGLVTGYFGSLTKSAVSNFQARNGISSIGRVGPVTLSAINAQMAGGVSGADVYAPSISGVNVSTTNSSATMSWNTSENSSAIIFYNTSPLPMTESSPTSSVTVGGTSLLLHTDLRTSHSGTLTGLQANTTYYYVLYVKDGTGNESITWPATFQTSN